MSVEREDVGADPAAMVYRSFQWYVVQLQIDHREKMEAMLEKLTQIELNTRAR